MHKILTTLALCLALSPAVADDLAPTAESTARQSGLVKANLVVSQGARPSDAPALGGRLAADDDRPAGSAQADAEHHHHTTSGMLLAALALMVAIALRRRGGSEQ